MSTKTGWAYLTSDKDSKDFKLVEYGKIEKVSEPEIPYPESYIVWAHQIFVEIEKLYDRIQPDVLVIEETASNSKSAYSQKILEWIHFLVAKNLVMDNTKAVYLMTEQWRRETGCLMYKEESKQNKEVKKYYRDWENF